MLVDHYSRYTWPYPLKLKSQVKETFKAFKLLVKNHFSTKIGTLYSDNGGEFIALRHLLSDAGISPPHTPEHNGISERKHKHVVETGLTLLTHASMQKQYWSYAFSTATYLINHLPTAVLGMDSPFHRLFGTQPNYTKTRVCGCLCFPWLRPYNKHKLEDRSMPCVFIGYSPTQSAYLCLQTHTGRIYVSRYVRFDETVFPFKTKPTLPLTSSSPNQPSTISYPQATSIPISTPPPPPPTAPAPTSPLVEQTGTSSSEPHQSVQVNSSTPTLSITNGGGATPDLSTGSASSPATSEQSSNSSPSDSATNNQSQHPQDSASQPQYTPTTSSSSPTPSTPPPSPPPPDNAHLMVTRWKNQISKPNPKYNYSAALSSTVPAEPNTLTQALKDKKWRGSMSTEIDAFAQNGTYSVVPRQPQYNVVGRRWLHKNKFNSDGTHRFAAASHD